MSAWLQELDDKEAAAEELWRCGCSRHTPVDCGHGLGHVLSLALLRPEFCEALIVAVEAFEQDCFVAGRLNRGMLLNTRVVLSQLSPGAHHGCMTSQQRPAVALNRCRASPVFVRTRTYAVLLSLVELKRKIDEHLMPVCQLLCTRLVPRCSALQEEIHSYVIRYKSDELSHSSAGGLDTASSEDQQLKCHMDDSDFTLNICLGRGTFSGSRLYFCTDATPSRPRTPDVEQEDAAGGVHWQTHEPGVGIAHPGIVWHGAECIDTGERWNLVLWCLKKDEEAGKQKGWRDGFYGKLEASLRDKSAAAAAYSVATSDGSSVAAKERCGGAEAETCMM